ncbi:MAG: hypothetical protein RLN75_02095 [Longimicrobiales bacterium]
MVWKPALLVALAALGAACGEATPPGAVTVTDSAGIRIVVSHAPVWSGEHAWRISQEPVLEIGGIAEGDQLLHDVRDIDRLSDGRWVVTHTGSSELRLYAPGGDFLESIGREGQGPGEFTFPTATWVTGGDSLVVREFQRVSVLGSDGAFARSSPASPWPPQDRFQDGTFLFTVVPPGLDTFEPGYSRPDQALVRAQADGSEADTLRIVEGTERYRFQSSAGGVSSHFAPFGTTRTAVVGGGDVYTTAGRTFEVVVLDGTGTVRSILRRTVQAETVTDRHVQALESAILESAPDRTHPDRRRMFLEWSYPDEMPVIDRLAVDAEGHLWVRAYSATPRTEREWSVMSAEGHWLGQVVTPAAFEVMEIGPDYIAGVHVDGLGVEHVQVFRLERT